MVRRQIAIAVGVASLVAAGTSIAACDGSSSDGAAPGADSGLLAEASDGGDAAAPGPGEVPPPASAAAFCDSTLGVVARALEACCTPDDQATREYKLAHGFTTGLLPVCTSVVGASIAHGRLAFHSDEASACYSAYAAAYAPGKCANITQTFSSPAGNACRRTFSGTVAAGGACAGDHECVDGLTCVGYTHTTDGTCRVPGAIGAPCGAAPSDGGGGLLANTSFEFGDHPACAPGARCSTSSRTCVAAAAAGSTCVIDEDCASPLLCHLQVCGSAGPDVAGGACKTKSDCVGGLYCDRPTNANGTCAPKKTAGAACTSGAFDSDCIGRCDADAGAAGICATFCGSP